MIRATSYILATALLLPAALAHADGPAVSAASPSSTGAGPLLHELRLGVMLHDAGGLWSGDRAESGTDLGLELVFNRPLGTPFNGVVRPNLGFTLNNQGDTSKIYGGVLWRWTNDHGVFVDLGLGLAVHDGERETSDPDMKQLGSKLLFRVPFEVGYEISARHQVSLFFEHISNAWLADENDGMDLVGVRYGYRFQ